MKLLGPVSRIALFLFVILCFFKNPSFSQELFPTPEIEIIEVDVGESATLPVEQIKRFLVLNPEVATASIVSPVSLAIMGHSRGETLIHIWDERGLWTVRVKVEIKEIRRAFEELERIEEELKIVPSLKIDYYSDYGIYERGVDIGRVERVRGVHNHRFILSGPTPYGRIDSLFWLERKETTRQDEKRVFFGERNLTFKLLEANVGPLRNFDLVIGDNYLALSPLTFPGHRFRGLTYRTTGHLRGDGLDQALGYTFFWGRSKPAVPVDIAEPEVENYYIGSRFDYQPDEQTRVFTTLIRRYGDPLTDRSDGAASLGLSLEAGILNFEAEGAWSEGNYGYTLGSGIRFSERLSLAAEFRDIQRDFFTPLGRAPGQGIRGWRFTANALPFHRLRLGGSLNYYQDRLSPNPQDRERFNLTYNAQAELTLPRSILFTTTYAKSDMTGSAFPSRRERLNFRVSKPLFLPFFTESLQLYLDYETRKSQNLIWPQRDYRNRKKEVGLSASLPWGFFISTSYQYNWLREPFYDLRSYPRRWRSSLSFSRRLFEALSWNAYLSYTEVEDAHSPFSYISNEDLIEGGVGLNWRISPTANCYFRLGLREHSPEVPGADDYAEMRVYLGGRIQFDTLIRITPRCGIRGVVFRDLDGDGLRDIDEPGIGGVRVYIGELTATTDSEGRYSFPRVRGRKVTVSIDALTLPLGYIYTTPSSQEVTVAHRKTIEINFGITVRTEIKGIVFCDTNENGVFDAEDFGLEDVILSLQTGQMTKTTKGGRYLLERLPPGPNKLWIEITSIPVGYLPVGPVRLKVDLVEGRTERINFPMVAQ